MSSSGLGRLTIGATAKQSYVDGSRALVHRRSNRCDARPLRKEMLPNH